MAAERAASSDPAGRGPPGAALCALCHGVQGSKDDWATWQRLLGELRPSWRVVPLESVSQASRIIIGEGVEEIAGRASQEILGALDAAERAHGLPLTLHCVGHSMGGLVLRGALPRVFERRPGLRAGAFMTLSSPHLGMQASWGAPQDMWKNLAWVTGAVSPQMPQIAIQDAADRPYLAALADPAGPHLAALRRFRRRLCVTMANGDPLVCTASGAIWADVDWEPLDLPPSQAAGWGFEALSRHAPEPRQPEDQAPGQDGADMAWTESADRRCWYPRQVLDGLLSLQWDRLTVRLEHASAWTTPHVFLIGKEEEQYSSLERRFSRDCVRRLVGLLARSAEHPCEAPPEQSEQVPLDVEAPSWVDTVKGEPEPRACEPDDCAGKWTVGAKHPTVSAQFSAFDREAEALYYYDSLGVAPSRVLFDPAGFEVQQSGSPVTGTCRSIHLAFNPPTPAPGARGQWVIGTEFFTWNVQFYCFDTGELASHVFDKAFLNRARILFDPEGAAVRRGGLNSFAYDTIRQAYLERCGDEREGKGAEGAHSPPHPRLHSDLSYGFL